MEWILVLGAVAAAVVLAGGRWYGRRRSGPIAEELGTPRDEPDWGPADEPLDRPQEMPPQVLDRASLLNRNRVLDPTAWDNTPDPAAAPSGDDSMTPPVILDRETLRSRQRGEDAPGAAPEA